MTETSQNASALRQAGQYGPAWRMCVSSLSRWDADFESADLIFIDHFIGRFRDNNDVTHAAFLLWDVIRQGFQERIVVDSDLQDDRRAVDRFLETLEKDDYSVFSGDTPEPLGPQFRRLLSGHFSVAEFGLHLSGLDDREQLLQGYADLGQALLSSAHAYGEWWSGSEIKRPTPNLDSPSPDFLDAIFNSNASRSDFAIAILENLTTQLLDACRGNRQTAFAKNR